MKRTEVFKTDRVPETWTGRRRMERPERPEMLAEVLPSYEHETSKYPDSIRVSYADGSTAVYVLAPQMPHPIIMENIKIIRKWNGYNNQPMRRRRKP